MIAFDSPANLEYIYSVIELYESKNAEIYVVELYADFDVRIERNKTENRLLNKPTKRNNTNLSPDMVALNIKKVFGL